MFVLNINQLMVLDIKLPKRRGERGGEAWNKTIEFKSWKRVPDKLTQEHLLVAV